MNELELYQKLGWKFIALNGKIPVHKEWQKKEYSLEDFRNYSNIGIQTGKVSGIIVVDVDNDDKPEWTINGTPYVKTGRGRHFYFKYQEGIKNSVGKLGPHIDIRSDNGFVVAPPSIHENGEKYTWIVMPEPDDPLFEFPDLPKEIVDKLKEYKPAEFGMGIAGELFFKEGTRNSSLTSLAGTMRNRGFGFEAIFEALKIENLNKCSPPLSENEIETIARSVCRYEPSQNISSVDNPSTRSLPSSSDPESTIECSIVKWSDLKTMEFEPVETIKTGIPCLDTYLDGGLGLEELSFFIGEQSVGKTTLSCFIGASAIKQGYNVLHVFYEDRLSNLKNRYANHLSGQTDNEVYFLNATRKPARVEDIENAIIKHNPGLVIVDYFFRIPSSRGLGESRFEARDTVFKLANLTREHKCHILVLDHIVVHDKNYENKPWCFKMTFGKVAEAKMYKLGIVDTMVGLMRDKDDIYITGMKNKRFANELFKSVKVNWITGRYEDERS